MRLLLFLVLAVGLVWCRTQEPTLTFRGGTAQVRADVMVLDNGKPLAGLTQSDFLVRDEGVETPVVFFGRESEPIQLLLVLDVSGSMTKLLNDMAAVARQALDVLKPADQVGVMLFTRSTKVSLDFTGEKAAATRALKEAPLDRDLGSGTAINAALLDAASYFRQQPPFPGRRAIVILTDQGSINYQASDEMVLTALAEVNAVVNAIVPSDVKPPKPVAPDAARNPDFTPPDVFKLAQRSGGEVLRTGKGGDRFKEMLEHVRVRYTVAFRPAAAPPGAFRRLEIQLTPEARKRYPKAEVRTRAGYFTAAE